MASNIGLGAVSERGSSVVRRFNVATTWEPNPLHGMVAMIAELGGVALHHTNSPFFDDVPGGLSATTSAHGTYGFEALFGLTGVVTLPFGNSMRRMMQAALLIQSALPAHRRCAQQGTQQRAHGDVCSVGVLAADLLTGNDGIQQIGLGAVRE